MAISVSQIRSAIASQITSALGASGFTESLIPPEYFGRNENSVAHKRFGVQVSISNAFPERQRRAVGVMMETTARVKFAYRLRPKDAYPTDYDLALDTEEEVIAAVLNSYQSIRPGVEIRFFRSARDITDSMEYMLFDIEFTTYHTISIT
jgi:hypothetical protein